MKFIECREKLCEICKHPTRSDLSKSWLVFQCKDADLPDVYASYHYERHDQPLTELVNPGPNWFFKRVIREFYWFKRVKMVMLPGDCQIAKTERCSLEEMDELEKHYQEWKKDKK